MYGSHYEKWPPHPKWWPLVFPGRLKTGTKWIKIRVLLIKIQGISFTSFIYYKSRSLQYEWYLVRQEKNYYRSDTTNPAPITLHVKMRNCPLSMSRYNISTTVIYLCVYCALSVVLMILEISMSSLNHEKIDSHPIAADIANPQLKVVKYLVSSELYNWVPTLYWKIRLRIFLKTIINRNSKHTTILHLYMNSCIFIMRGHYIQKYVN